MIARRGVFAPPEGGTPGYASSPLAEVSQELVTHELCHVWQMQHHPLRMPLSYVVRGYDRNPYELEARRASNPEQAVTATRALGPGQEDGGA